MTVWDEALTAVKHEEPKRVPVVLWAYGPVLKRFFRVSEYEYYRSVRLQLEAKIFFQRRFPEALNLYTVPEYAAVGLIPTAFGAELRWLEDSPPWIVNYPVKTPEDVDRLAENGVPDPGEVEVASENLRRYEYFYDWFPRDLREEYGYVDGWVYTGLCVEGAALAMGYDKFLLWMRLHPDVLHKWLKLTTEFLVKYCSAIENMVGKCRVLVIADHIASMMGVRHFEEFVLSYLNKLLKRYPKAVRIWHNEGSVKHILKSVDKVKADVWHFGASDPASMCKAETHFCLMGNLYPPRFVRSSPKWVEERCKRLISEAAYGGGFWLSTGGGLASDTPMRNLDAMIKAVKIYGVYPLKCEPD